MLSTPKSDRCRHPDIEKERIELGHYYHSAGSFHVYETHFNMMDKIVQNYGAKHHSNSYKNPYPNLKKYKLKDTITLQSVRDLKLSLPSDDLSKEEINDISQKSMELIYV